MRKVPSPVDATRMKLDSERRSLGSGTYFEDFREKEGTHADISELFHENTKIKQVDDKFVDSIEYFTRGQEETGGGFAPVADRVDLPLVELPDPQRPSLDLSDAIARRRSVREYEDEPITVDELSTLLRYGCGAIGDDMIEYESVDFKSRGYPSAGGLYPIEPYVVALNADGLETGVYYYSAQDHGLRVIDEVPRDDLLDRVEPFSSAWQMDYESASVLFAMTGLFWKNKIKYGPRGYRFALLEAGHAMQNVQLVAGALGLGTCNIGGLDEDELDPFLGVNGVDESTVYGCLIGTPASGGETDGY